MGMTMTQKILAAHCGEAAVTAGQLINAKLDIVRSYMQDAWNINIDDLRDAVLRRASELNTIDLDHLN